MQLEMETRDFRCMDDNLQMVRRTNVEIQLAKPTKLLRFNLFTGRRG